MMVQIDKTDIFIVDLRLFEKTDNDYLTITDIENLSGIKVLKSIKEKNPTAVVIILYCIK